MDNENSEILRDVNNERDSFYTPAGMIQQDSPLREAVKKGNLGRVHELINDYDINVPNHKGWTLIHESAVSDCLFDVFQYLISAGAKINFKTDAGVSPLYVACRHGSLKIAETLIYAGCEVNEKFCFDYEFNRVLTCNFTLLHIACACNQTAVIELLLKNNADVNAKDSEGRTPAFYALIERNVDGFMMLLNAGADLLTKDNYGSSILNYATRPYFDVEIYILIQPYFFDRAILNEQPPGGRTVLMNTCFSGNYTIADELIKMGADVTLVDSEGLLALHLAALSGFGVFKLMLQHTPVDIIEKYSTFRSRSEKWCSLPCSLIESKCFESLQLLYSSGLSEEVLKCPNNQLLSPIALLFSPAYDELEDEVVLRFLDFLLSHEYLVDPDYEEEEILQDECKFGEKPITHIKAVEAVIQRHHYCYAECHCKLFLNMILNKGASFPHKLLPNGYLRQFEFFCHAVQYGFIEALHLLKYSEYVDPDDIMRAFLRWIFDIRYTWKGHEEDVVNFLLDKCTTNFMERFIEMKNYADRFMPMARNPNMIWKFEGFLRIHKIAQSNNSVPSLKRMCRYGIRKIIQRKAEKSMESFQCCLKNIFLPHCLYGYLRYYEDF